MTMHDRIHVEVPASDARRDRVEREVFRRLAAARETDRIAAVDAVARLAPSRVRRYALLAIPAAAAAMLAIVLAVHWAREAGPAAPSAPARIVTPAGGSSRFSVGDAVVEAGGETSVEVLQHGDAVTLVLERGRVECEVAPRGERAPFRVLGGEVRVEVVGTRFAVTRLGPGARVDVAHGKVRVFAPEGERLLAAGESWTPVVTEVARGGGATASASGAEVPVSRREAFAAAQRLEVSDHAGAAAAYRALADGRDAWAALALYSLAELRVAAEPALALRDLDELARRFPAGANAEDAAWLRIDVLRRLGRAREMREAAAAYLRAFPGGTYVRSAAQLAGSR